MSLSRCSRLLSGAQKYPHRRILAPSSYLSKSPAQSHHPKCPCCLATNNRSYSSEQRSFGSQYVKPSEHTSMVHQVFQSVSSSYDVMNDLMSFTTHRCWKNHMIKGSGYCRAVGDMQDATFLDVAGGTGDIAELIIDELSGKKMGTRASPVQQEEKARDENAPEEHPVAQFLKQKSRNGKVIISDINGYMLEEGKKRYQRTYNSHSLVKGVPVQWFEANAEDLSAVPDNSIDGYSISFGIRNVTNIEKALREAYRVLKPGGHFICMEFSKVDTPVVREFYDWYSYNVIPTMGEVVANDRASYQYLVESIRKFPDQETFLRMIQDAGFKNCYYENLTFGVVAIHHGFKI